MAISESLHYYILTETKPKGDDKLKSPSTRVSLLYESIVPPQSTWLSEKTTTGSTGVWFLSSVAALMALQGFQLGEGPSMFNTVEGAPSTVCLSVSFEPDQLDKGHTVFLALVWLVMWIDHFIFG